MAVRRPVERADHVHQRGLAGAARTHDGDKFARQDFQRDAAHGVNVHLARVICLVDIVQLDDVICLHGGCRQ